ncbi:PilN domain-containing protein [Ottowia testudinis]|uniref:PilN domain-containing protein n=1 Tax=Ottowia testudinis TaxID=2816950 RepID=A0A975H3B2_9BURK|nr:PilN domain-containing protein [Ottowia testudinis]QTD45046.1 PilN domain-containing protein [Ottowia testudinis]
MSTIRVKPAVRLRAAWDRLAWGLSELRRTLIARGMWPASSIQAVSLVGRPVRIIGTRVVSAGAAHDATSLLVPHEAGLWGEFRLPDMPRRSLAAAVHEAMWRVSPLPPDQVVSVWRSEPDADGGWLITWGLCPNAILEQGLVQTSLPADAPVYLARTDDEALSVHGPAMAEQDRRQRRLDLLYVSVLLVLAAALALPALMPLVLKRQAVVRAVQHVSTVEPMAAPLRVQLDELRQQARVAQELRQSIDHSLPLASVLDRLAVALPDDTWLDRFEVNGDQIRISGLTSNAADLMARVSKQPDFAEVRATAATVRDDAQNKERFGFEMRWRGGVSKS